MEVLGSPRRPPPPRIGVAQWGEEKRENPAKRRVGRTAARVKSAPPSFVGRQAGPDRAKVRPWFLLVDANLVFFFFSHPFDFAFFFIKIF